jgi:hypothetical protein
MAGEFIEMVKADENFARMLDAAVKTPRGYAYIRTAVVAQMMGVSLSHCWNTHGKDLLAILEQQVEKQRAMEGTSGKRHRS